MLFNICKLATKLGKLHFSSIVMSFFFVVLVIHAPNIDFKYVPSL